MSNREWAEMKVSGLLGFIHKLVMFITFPFRKFWYIIGLLLIVAIIILAVPLIKKVPFSGIWNWYANLWQSSEFIKVKNHVEKLKLQTASIISDTKSQISEKVEKISPTKITKEEEPRRFVAWNVAKFNRVKYEQKTDTPQDVAIKAPTFAKIKEQAKAEKDLKIAEEKQKLAEKYQYKYYEGKLSDFYNVRNDLGLEYLAQSEKHYAKADIVGPNSLYIDGTFVFLYGIYTNPNMYDVEAAWHYLEDITKDQMVHCDIVAYTTQTQAATALCFVNNIFINKAMVENNLAKNVALK